MKTHTLIFVATLVAMSTVGSAQEYAFKVLANKGNNEVKSGATWQPLKTGTTLHSGDELRLGDNAYIGLVHTSGKPVEVKQSGVHKVAELEAKVPSGSSVLSKYTDFILSSNSAEAKKNSLNATGAVHRGDPNDAASAAIKLLLPEEAEHTGIYNSTAFINWEADGKGQYVVTVKNMFEDVVETAETPETSYKIDLSSAKYAAESAIFVQVSSKADPKLVSKRHLIKRLSAAEVNKISATVQEIKAQLGEETAVNKVYLANFYEQNNLLIDAIYAYRQALLLEPEAFNESYEEFLLRNNLK
jgi:hypothetical protein